MRYGIATFVLVAMAGAAEAKSLRERFDEIDELGGDWYKDNPAGLAWGQSYVMQSYVDAYRATHDPKYLDRLAYAIDNTLALTDKARGLADFRGQSRTCWQSTGYSTKPVCWAAHSGMLASPMAELAAFVAREPALASHVTYDGTTLGAKAVLALDVAKQAAAVHDTEWRQDTQTGWYVFPPDASFYQYKGMEVPPNMYGAMGLLYIALADATGDATYRDRATRLAKRFRGRLVTAASGAYLWNYWNPGYTSAGEDLPHAALNINFVLRAARSGIEFTGGDVARFVKTFVAHTYIDSATIFDHIGGGAKMTHPKRLDVGFLALLGGHDPVVHAIVRDAYELQDADMIGGVRSLRGLSGLLATELPVERTDFYKVDWKDLGDGRKQATAAGANILSYPADPTQAHVIKFRYEASRPAIVQQYDGAAYHTVAVLAPTHGVPAIAYVGYRPEHFHDYGGGVLFQFAGEHVAGDGIIIELIPSETDDKADEVDGSSDDENEMSDIGGCSAGQPSTTASMLIGLLFAIVRRRRGRARA